MLTFVIRQVRKSALGRLLKPLFNLDDIEFPTESLLTPLREGSNEVCMYSVRACRGASATGRLKVAFCRRRPRCCLIYGIAVLSIFAALLLLRLRIVTTPPPRLLPKHQPSRFGQPSDAIVTSQTPAESCLKRVCFCVCFCFDLHVEIDTVHYFSCCVSIVFGARKEERCQLTFVSTFVTAAVVLGTSPCHVCFRDFLSLVLENPMGRPGVDDNDVLGRAAPRMSQRTRAGLRLRKGRRRRVAMM